MLQNSGKIGRQGRSKAQFSTCDRMREGQFARVQHLSGNIELIKHVWSSVSNIT